MTKTEYNYETEDIDEDADNWNSVKYFANFILKESELFNGTVNIELAITKELSISGIATLTEVSEVPILLRC